MQFHPSGFPCHDHKTDCEKASEKSKDLLRKAWDGASLETFADGRVIIRKGNAILLTTPQGYTQLFPKGLRLANG